MLSLFLENYSKTESLLLENLSTVSFSSQSFLSKNKQNKGILTEIKLFFLVKCILLYLYLLTLPSQFINTLLLIVTKDPFSQNFVIFNFLHPNERNPHIVIVYKLIKKKVSYRSPNILNVITKNTFSIIKEHIFRSLFLFFHVVTINRVSVDRSAVGT